MAAGARRSLLPTRRCLTLRRQAEHACAELGALLSEVPPPLICRHLRRPRARSAAHLPVPPRTASAAYPLQVRQMDLKLEEVRLIQGNFKDTADIGGRVARLV